MFLCLVFVCLCVEARDYAQCLPQSLPTLVFEMGFPSELSLLIRLGRPASECQGHPRPVSTPSSGVVGV